MDEEPQQDPKISLVEIIIIGLIFVVFDIVGFFLFVIVIVNWIIDIIAALIFFYLFIKGVPPMRQLVCWLLELIPWVGALPLLTIGWGLTVWADRHPSGALAKAGALAGTAQGKAALSKGAAKTRGAGARSFEQMGRAEGRAQEWKAKLDEKIGARPSQKGQLEPEKPQPSAAKGPSPKEAAERESGEENAKQAEKSTVPKEAFGEKPTPLEELGKLTQETPGQPQTGENPDEEEDEEAA